MNTGSLRRIVAMEERRFTVYFRDLPSDHEVENLVRCLLTVGDYSVHEFDAIIRPRGLSWIGLMVSTFRLFKEHARTL